LAIPFVVIELLGRGPITHIWRKPSRAELNALLAEGDSIVLALDAYYAKHRKYFSDLPDSPDTSRAAKYGGWRYACTSDCASFELYVGHYRDYSFEIHRRFGSKTWYVDT
jgi:hypothetical protein